LVQSTNGHIPPNEVNVNIAIDSGSFGSIYQATYRGKPVVFKRIEQENGSDHIRELISPILVELQAVSVLKHPNIVGFEGMILDFPLNDRHGNQTVTSGFVFEHCQLGNVFNHIFGLERRLAYWGDRLRVSCEVAAGMAYIHDNYFIHRDLNSQNVVLTSDMRAKICDFGTARHLGPSGSFQPTHIEGSPCAMSPEQFTGNILTLRSDVWQMGIFLWEVFAMRRPWGEVLRPTTAPPPHPSILMHRLLDALPSPASSQPVSLVPPPRIPRPRPIPPPPPQRLLPA
jgi:serine/threonine protein kinase